MLTWSACRLGDTARPRVCYSQELLLCSHTTNGRGHAESGQNLAVMGLEHWEAHSEVSLSDNKDQHQHTSPKLIESCVISTRHINLTNSPNPPHIYTDVHYTIIELFYTATLARMIARIHCNTNYSNNMDGPRLGGTNIPTFAYGGTLAQRRIITLARLHLRTGGSIFCDSRINFFKRASMRDRQRQYSPGKTAVI